MNEEEESRRLMRGMLAGAFLAMPFWMLVIGLWVKYG
jgi:hypothetical protein